MSAFPQAYQSLAERWLREASEEKLRAELRAHDESGSLASKVIADLVTAELRLRGLTV